MKKKSLRSFTWQSYEPYKDSEGTTTEAYSDDSSTDQALFWYTTSKLQAELYGERINDMLNMHYYGDLAIQVHDLITFDGVAYTVIGLKKYHRFVEMELERNVKFN